jgi:hypothetical protein
VKKLLFSKTANVPESVGVFRRRDRLLANVAPLRLQICTYMYICNYVHTYVYFEHNQTLNLIAAFMNDWQHKKPYISL